MTPGTSPTSATALGSLRAENWPPGAYDHTRLPERVLQFGTGMLLRALVAASVDAANRRAAFGGRIVVVQSTPHGNAGSINSQTGLFTLVERGLEDGAPVERTRLIGSISRALVADTEWPAVRDAVAKPEVQVIVSNVTEAGFRLDDRDVADPPRSRTSFPGKLADLLYTRFERLPAGPTLYVVPTELVADNGAELEAMVERLAGRVPRAADFRAWLSSRVRFCSSLVDRITTGAPDDELRRELESRLGYSDALCTVTEPHALWAIEADPVELRAAFAIDDAPGVVFAPDITFYRERKIRMLNGAHTATAPLALLAGVPTVREAAEHPRLGPFLHRILFDEIPAGTDLPAETAASYARQVLDRFRNPWLAHPWQVIATNQTAKFRLRVAPSIVGFVRRRRSVPQGLALGCAAYLRVARAVADGTYSIADADLPAIDRHGDAAAVAAGTLPDSSLASLPGFLDDVKGWLLRLERDGVDAALDTLARAEVP